MPKSRRRLEIWLGLAALAVGLVLAAIGGLWTYMRVTAKPLHPDADAVAVAAGHAPDARWADAAAQARHILQSGAAAQNLPGVSAAVSVRGQLVWAEGAGWANLDTHAPVTPDTRFRIGTSSKALTSAAVGWLIDRGRLSLDDDVRKYVPTYPAQPWPVTVRQAMADTAGIPTDGGDEGPFSEQCAQTLDALRLFADRPLLFEPGTRYRASSYGWMLVSAVVEGAADEPFYAFMRRQVFEPLGMTATRETEPLRDVATEYFPRFAGDPKYGPDLNRDMDMSCYAGASAYFSTPSDLVRFGSAMDTDALVTPSTAAQLRAEQTLASGAPTGHGLGWTVSTTTLHDAPVSAISSRGELMGGPVATLIRYPAQGLVVAVLANIPYANTAALARQLAEVFSSPR